ncbi:MAG: type II toxin-antitoxin system Phd/YefM family antitoxin [Hyphomicrobiales bacterium]|nr:type II toxin-antitoxin system Phd/YefM family antitoxin [Hyphomicrobiales bacterium]
MRMSYMTSAVFNQNPSKAKKKADEHPLVITDHGLESYVLFSYSDFQEHWRERRNLLDALRDPSARADLEFEPGSVDFAERPVEF